MPWGQFLTIIAQAIIAGVVLFVLGAVVSVIYDGFRKKL